MRITHGGVVVVMHLYLLGQCPELNSGHRLKLLILIRFKSFCPTLACTIPAVTIALAASIATILALATTISTFVITVVTNTTVAALHCPPPSPIIRHLLHCRTSLHHSHRRLVVVFVNRLSPILLHCCRPRPPTRFHPPPPNPPLFTLQA
jgi:hypothetical protein